MLDAQGYDEKQRRDRAARILGSWEMLAWHGISNGEVCVGFFALSAFYPISISIYIPLPLSSPIPQKMVSSFPWTQIPSVLPPPISSPLSLSSRCGLSPINIYPRLIIRKETSSKTKSIKSLPQTRLRFEKSLIGLQDSSEGEDADEWEDAFSDDSGSDSDDEGGRDRSEGAENNHSKGKGNKKDSTTTTRKQQEGNKNRDKDKDKDKKNKKEAGRRGR